MYLSLTDFCELFSLVVTVYFSLLFRLTVITTKHIIYNVTCLFIFFFLTFMCPCIASISPKYNQQNATVSRTIHFYKLLYMFQAVPPQIIRSTKLYIQHQVLSNQVGSSIGLTVPDAVCTVLCS